LSLCFVLVARAAGVDDLHKSKWPETGPRPARDGGLRCELDVDPGGDETVGKPRESDDGLRD